MGPEPECSVNMYAIVYSSTLVQRSPFKTATPKKEFVKLNRVTKWLHVWRTNGLIILINQPSVIRLINLPIHVHPYFAFVARLWIAKRSNIIGSLCNEGIDTFLLSHESSHSIHLGKTWEANREKYRKIWFPKIDFCGKYRTVQLADHVVALFTSKLSKITSYLKLDAHIHRSART